MTSDSANPLAEAALSGKRALVTGSSRGIGADTARYLAEAGARVVINYRSKAPRADKLVAEIEAAGGQAMAVGADLTDDASRGDMFTAITSAYGGLDLLVLNASGGMEKAMGDDYALRLNRDAQVATLEDAMELMGPGSRVVFVTSHQAHFIESTPTMPEYEPVARSKRAGELALRERLPQLTERGIEFVVVSGDMIEGTVTATLLNRMSPGALEARREEAGKLYSVAEFAAEIAEAAVDPIPEGNLRLVGDASGFTDAAAAGA